MSSLSITDQALRGSGSLASPLPTTNDWRLSLINDEAIDDADKSFTVPADTEYLVVWIWVELTTSVGPGNRQIVVEIHDAGADVISTWAVAGATRAGGAAVGHYLFAPRIADLAAFRDTTYLTTPIPETALLQEGDVLRVYDKAGIDVADDLMIVQIQLMSRLV